MAKKRKQQALPWCWYHPHIPQTPLLFMRFLRYCDREFEDEKVLINHQKAKHFKCLYCHKKLNSGSGLVIHIAQLHKEAIVKIPNALEGHDTPEIEIYGMDGVPEDDLRRHREGLPMVPYKRSRLMEPGAGMLPLLAAQKAAIPELPTEPHVQVAPALPPPPSSFKPAGTSNPISANSSNDSVGKDKASAASGIVSAAAISYSSPPMPMQPPVGYPAGMPSYYPSPYYPGYGAPYYPPQSSPYGYPGYPPQYYPPQHPPYYAPPSNGNPPPYGMAPYAGPPAVSQSNTIPRDINLEAPQNFEEVDSPVLKDGINSPKPESRSEGSVEAEVTSKGADK
jgi:hypothetical protein